MTMIMMIMTMMMMVMIMTMMMMMIIMIMMMMLMIMIITMVMMRVINGYDLTRFNKICHPSQRPRWQVDKEAIGLSRVQQCSSTYNPPS